VVFVVAGVVVVVGVIVQKEMELEGLKAQKNILESVHV
jgi:hypothetical protein